MLAVHFVLSVYPVFTYTPKMIFGLGFHLFPLIPNQWIQKINLQRKR